ncbi:MAG: ubiquinone/menaquinone biosynthesis methyltransferase [Acidobacteriota bacterium]|nr:ubiquinone/menaquinone biosynthesis methyltransferase [Acidobacteriota bacterium]MDQ7087425.1 ubiquinone/menaquinone biosynthesis methyltransferase [Acidobacteriota bacterium]
MFDGIARRYDLLNRLTSFGLDLRWRRETVRALGTDLGEGPVLDLATGTGDLALAIARAHRRVKVIGLDPSRAMLERGRAKIHRAGLGRRIAMQRGAAENLPLASASMAAVTIAFGIRNVPRRHQALQEMKRVTRPGGRIAVLELTEPHRGPLAPLARLHVRHVVPLLGALLSGAREYSYLRDSIGAFPPPESFAGEMEAAGLRVLTLEPMTFGACCLFVATPGTGSHR